MGIDFIIIFKRLDDKNELILTYPLKMDYVYNNTSSFLL